VFKFILLNAFEEIIILLIHIFSSETSFNTTKLVVKVYIENLIPKLSCFFEKDEHENET